MRANEYRVLVTFDDVNHYPAVTDGTRWNGFLNVRVDASVVEAMITDGQMDEFDPEAAEELRTITPDEDGLIDLSGGWTATEVDLSDEEAQAIAEEVV